MNTPDRRRKFGTAADGGQTRRQTAARFPAFSRGWVASLTGLASGTSMRELTVRALHHAAALGDPGAAAAARLLAADVDNPVLRALLA